MLSCASLPAQAPPPNGPGSALSLDGANDFVHIPHSPALTISNRFTLEFWFKPASLSQRLKYLLSHNGLNSLHQAAVIFGYSATNEVEFYALGYSGPNPRDGSRIVLPDTAWHHLAYSYNGTQWAGYLDGTQMFSTNQIFSLSTLPNDWAIGTAFPYPSPDTNYVAGAFDEVRIWNVGRTGPQIQESMRRQLWGNESGLVGYWRFDEGTGLTAADATINAQTASLVNGPSWITSSLLPFAPSVTTYPAKTPLGFANPNGGSTAGWFEWGLSAAYGNVTPPESLGSGTASMIMSNIPSGLMPGVKYHFRALATNLHGASYGRDEIFGFDLTNIVSNLNDNGPGSLRAAILDSSPGVATIVFAPGLSGTIVLTSGEIVINRSIRIQGPGAGVLRVALGPTNAVSGRLLNVASGRVHISGLSLAGGRVVGETGGSGSFPGSSGEPGGTACGGGILNRGYLTLVDCLIAECATVGGRGGDAVTDGLGFPAGAGGAGGGAFGAAICNSNLLELLNCTIYKSACFGGQGGTGGPAENVSPYQGGLGGNGGGAGGAVFNAGFLYATNCTFYTNSALAGIGGQGGQGGSPTGRGGAGGNGGLASGGAILDVSTSVMVNCTISGNRVRGNSGGAGGVGGTGNGVNGSSVLSVGGGIDRRNGPANGNFIRNCLVAGNPASLNSDCSGTFTSGGFNLVGETHGTVPTIGFTQPTDQVGGSDSPGIDPRLAPFGYYGGQTPVLPLLADSPALDRGHGAGVGTDQRGFLRPVDVPTVANAAGGDGSDIGAYERGTHFVTNLNDSGPGSLRQTIREIGPDESVLFASGLVGTITLTSGEIPISWNTRIEAPGPALLAVSGNNASRVFRIAPNNSVHISGLMIRDGAVLASGTDANGNGMGAEGGGILNQGTLYLTNCFVINNRVVGADGGPPNGWGGAGIGGGIYHLGPSLRMDRCTIRGNSATGGGSGRSPQGSGGGGTARGGGVGASDGSGVVFSFYQCTIDANVARGGLGRTAFNNINGGNAPNGGEGGSSQGGGIFEGLYNTLSVVASTISSNLAIAGNGGAGGSIENCLNCRSGDGGHGGSATGGGLYLLGANPNQFVNSTLTGNAALGGEGGVPGLGPSAGFFGVGGTGGSANGGGVKLGFTGGLRMNHCTIIANTARGGAGGQGIDPPERAPNGAGSAGGYSITDADPFSLETFGSIIAANLALNGAGQLNEDLSDVDAFDISSKGFNLVGRARILIHVASTGDQFGGVNGLPHPLDPQLRPLRNNGGPTLTHGLALTSPARDKGSIGSLATADQRGFARPVDFPSIPNGPGDASDIGAVEELIETIEVVDTVTDSGVGSLRQAILNANAAPDPGLIDLRAVAGATFNLLSPLPPITQPVIIDGSVLSESGGSGFSLAPTPVPVPGTVLDGSMAGAGAHGLVIQSSDVIVRGLVIHSFSGHGILLSNANGCLLETNYIGTDATGTAVMGNGGDGIRIERSATNRIQHSRICGNGGHGVHILGPEAPWNQVYSTSLGAFGDVGPEFGNGLDGVRIELASNAVIGVVEAAGNHGHGLAVVQSPGTQVGFNRIGNVFADPVYRPVGNSGHGVFVVGSPFMHIFSNVIGPNGGNGVRLDGATTRNCRVRLNFVGVHYDGAEGFGNNLAGVAILDASDNTIGSAIIDGFLDENVIAYNAAGVTVSGLSATNNAIRRNVIYSNAGLGIDLEENGMTPNDAGDADTGPNHLQNFPVLTFASRSYGMGSAEGTLDSRANTHYSIDFYANATCDGEGQVYVGTASVVTDAAGHASFNEPLLSADRSGRITAVAIDDAGNTSEFSPCIPTVFSPPPNGPGSALSFDGVDDFVRIPHSPALTISNHFTLEFWFKPASLSQGANYLLSHNGLDAGGQSAVIFGYAGPNIVEFYALGYSGPNPRNNSSIPLPDTAWHHLAYSYDGLNWAGYLDGTQVFNVTNIFSLSTVSNDWLVGASFPYPGADNVAGAFDEVRIWNVGRSGAQIREAMRRQLWGDESGLVGYWRFDEGSDTTATDATINVQNATLVNGPIWITSNILPFAPEVGGGLEAVLSPASARLLGTGLANNSPTMMFFQWGLDRNYGNTTPPVNFGSGTDPGLWRATLEGLSPGTTYHARAAGTNAWGASYGLDFTFTTPPRVFINEWSALPTLDDDWIELYNPNDFPVDLGGYSLTDDLNDPFKSPIPADGFRVIPPKGFLLVVADDSTNKTTPSSLHANFRLNGQGESIGLFAANGATVDTVTFTKQLQGVTEGRYPDGAPAREFLARPTPLAPNVACPTNGPLVVMNGADYDPGTLRHMIACAPAGGTVMIPEGTTNIITLSDGELAIDKDLTLLGPGADRLLLQNPNGRVLRVGSARVRISGLTLSGQVTGTNGVDANTLPPGSEGGQGQEVYGGGILLRAGDLTVVSCLFSNNLASGGQGGTGRNATVSTAATLGGWGGDSYGGAIAVFNGGRLTLLNCSFMDCAARGGNAGRGGNGAGSFGSSIGGRGGWAQGGVIYNATGCTLSVTNCTLTLNRVVGGLGGNGGTGGAGSGAGGAGGQVEGSAIANDGLFTLVSATVVSNTCAVGTGGSGSPGGPSGQAYGAVRSSSVSAANAVRNSIIAANQGSSTPDVLGGFTSDGFNLIGATNGATGFNLISDQSGRVGGPPLDPGLLPLERLSGPLPVMPLAVNSRAHDRGHASGTSVDQRGYPRPIDDSLVTNAPGGDGSDIGAFEAQAPPDLSIRLGLPNGGVNTVILSWPVSAAGYVLQQTGNMSGAGGGWTDVSQTPAIIGTNKQVTLPASGQFCLFRLRHL